MHIIPALMIQATGVPQVDTYSRDRHCRVEGWTPTYINMLTTSQFGVVLLINAEPVKELKL